MVDRLFQIVYLLMEKPKMTAKELANMFEVSERTIYRDIDKLSLAGVPVYTSKGKEGGISLLPDYVLNKAVLTEEEKMDMSASLNALKELAYQNEKKNGSKLQMFLGDKFQDWLEVDFSSWGNSEKETDTFDILKKAILTCRYVEIVYAGNYTSFTKRTIKPLKLCFKNQAWYLYAYCCLREDYRFFKLQRLSELNVSDECFEAENVGKVLRDASNEYVAKQEATKVTLQVDSKLSFRAYDELSDVVKMDNDKVQCTVEVTDLEWFVDYVLSYGPHVKVLEPPFVQEMVISSIDKLKRIYEEKS